MINSLELVNFKRHEALTLAFTEGLNVIRAANESGKSTIYNAIGYAFWGSRALPLSLDETVTWGKPVSSLKVKLNFSHTGQTFNISRSKSSAELTGPGLLVSGQAEVTAFVERLLGVGSAVGEATLMASQGRLQDGLDSSAVSLIEKLSNMALIDSVIGKIQDTLPSGNTRLVESLVAGFAGLTLPDTSTDKETSALVKAEAQKQEAEDELLELRLLHAEVEPVAKQANIDRAIAKDSQARKLELEQRLANYTAAIRPMPEPVKGPTVQELQVSLEAQKVARKKEAAFNKLSGVKSPEHRQSFKEFEAEFVATTERLEAAKAAVRKLVVDHATIKASGIYEDSCSLCGKLLTDVPEVVEVNAKVKAKLLAVDEQLSSKSLTIDLLEKSVRLMRDVATADTETVRFAESISEFVSVDRDSRPYVITWSAGDFEDPSPLDYSALIASRSAEDKARDRLVATVEEAQKHVAKLQAELSQCVVKELKDSDLTLVVREADLAGQIKAQAEKVKECAVVCRLASSNMENAKRLVQYELKQYEENLEAKQKSEASLLDMTFHNELIKKLRAARPVVARELWGMVLQGVSQVFSQIRGIDSVVTRSDDKFLIDGKLSAAYSGSTKDSLGLAIRIMLQKTFLGNVDFMLLDEPAAGADSVREADMIASVTRAEYKQVLLVTHSEVADTFANNIITL